MSERPYRPSNVCQGMDFFDAFCHRCAKDAKFRESGLGQDGCPIVSDTFLYKASDPRYPKEWVQDESGPRCAAFEEAKP